jgi:hypothetical protein
VVHGHTHNTGSPKIVKNNLLLPSVVVSAARVVSAVVVAAVVRVVVLVVFVAVFVMPPGLLDAPPELLGGFPAMVRVSGAKAIPRDGPGRFVRGVENPHKGHYFPVLGVFLVMAIALALLAGGRVLASAAIGLMFLLFVSAHFSPH